ncbi:MAG: tetratricopeptide repeat protein [Bacteroidales bacterium]|jgi:tetratricopeptide (TPR) repeat protein|nr:tetratricopeptide repeat protein [Bacteroidales bacterium]
MSAKKTKESKAEKNFENIGEALTTSEQFLEKNQKSILIGLLIVVITVGAFLAYNYLYKVPRNEKAQASLFKGERYFQNGEDSLALFGNGNDYIGFESIINQFKGTKTADLARAYAGISYNRMGNNEKALEHLKKFKGGDILITHAVAGAIGDVQMNMGQTDDAISSFLKAAKEADDRMLSPIYYKKAGMAYLNGASYDKAIEVFTQIKENYIDSPEAQEADKFIKQAELLKETN